MKRPFLFLILVCFVFSSALWAQSSFSPATGSTDSNMFDMTGFPLWAKDLRRGEIIAFGSFPFAYFLANMMHNVYRYASHGWDTNYSPFVSGSIGQSQNEKFITIGLSAGTAVAFAVIDYGIMRYKRSRLEKANKGIVEEPPVIIRTPLYTDESPETGSTSETTQ